VPCWKNCKQYTQIHSCIEHVQILTQSPFTTIERTIKEFGVSNHLVIKPSIEQRKGCSKRVLQNFFTMLATHTPFFLYSQELFDCFHLFHRIQQVFVSAQVTLLCPCSWCPLLECPFPYALLFFTKRFKAPNSFIFLSVVKEDWG